MYGCTTSGIHGIAGVGSHPRAIEYGTDSAPEARPPEETSYSDAYEVMVVRAACACHQAHSPFMWRERPLSGSSGRCECW